MSEPTSRHARPLSPHLQVYRLIPTMLASIMHRITGIVLYGGMFILAWWLFAAASSPAYFDWVNTIVGSWLGLIVLFGFTWALIHHMLGGIKHLVQDTGRAMEKDFTTRMAKLHFAASILLTILVWVIALAAR